jgi:hypothetical protein
MLSGRQSRNLLKIFSLLLINLCYLSGAEPESKADTNFCKTRLSDAINRFQPAIVPVLSIDGRNLFFDRQHYPENTGGIGDSDDIWLSSANQDGSFGQPVRIQRPVNSDSSDVLFSISPDGGRLLIYSTQLNNPSGQGAFQICDFGNGIINNCRQLGIEAFRNRSRNFYGNLSGDGQTLILAIEDDGGFGNLDLYVSFLSDDGIRWSKPKSLGKTINTALIEGAPYLAYDNRTLYFCSDGHGGSGEMDIFMTRRLDESWTKWSKPQNLTSAVNTPMDENSIWLTALADSAYIVSYDTLGRRAGIYTICLPNAFRPEPYVMLQLNISSDDDSDIPGQIQLMINDRRLMNIPVTNKKSIVSIPALHHTHITLKSKGFDDVNFSLETGQVRAPIWVKKDINLKKSASEGPDVSFFYDIDSYKLNKQQIKYLKKLVREKKPKSILIRSSADSAGTEEYNIRLSKNRAEHIRNLLNSYGIPIKIELEILGEKDSTGPDAAIYRRSEVYLRDR